MTRSYYILHCIIHNFREEHYFMWNMVHRVTPKGFIPHFIGYAFSLLTSDIKKAEKRKNDYKDQCFTQTGTPIIIYETHHSNWMRQFINLDSKNLKKKKRKYSRGMHLLCLLYVLNRFVHCCIFRKQQCVYILGICFYWNLPVRSN